MWTFLFLLWFDRSAFELHLRFRALRNFSGNKVTAPLPPSQVRSYPYAYINSSWNVISYYCLLLFWTVIKILHNRYRTIPLFVLLFGFLFCVIFQISQILKVPVFFFVKREILILFPVNCEGTNLFCVKRDLDLHSPFTTLSVRLKENGNERTGFRLPFPVYACNTG